MKSRNAKFIDNEVFRIMNILNNGNDNYIFGNGWMGHKFLEAVRMLGFEVKGFLVSEKKQAEEGYIPVFTIDELSKKEGKKNIFVALRDQSHELNERLKNFCEILCPITYPGDITLVEAKYYLDYFKKKKIDCSEKIIHIKNDTEKYDFINPFFKSDDYLLSWVYEAGDLLLPVLFQDDARIDEGCYEIEHVELEKDDIVLDCGANIGLFSGIAAQKGCNVYAFEPMPEAISYLEELNRELALNIAICPYALSDKVGKGEFLVQNNDLIGASLFEGHNNIDKRIKIDIMTVDEFVLRNHLERVDYIKADIEGSERDMLRGAKKTIKKYMPKISICTYHLKDDKEVLENIIREISDKYVIEHRWKKLYAYVPDRK